MDISFIIITWNSEQYIEECVNSVLESINKFEYEVEIYIIDNGSQDNTVSILKTLNSHYPELIFPIYLNKNMGTTVSRNLALKRVKGEYLCIIDSDLIISPNVVPALIKTFNNAENIGLVVPKLIYPNGKLQKSVDYFPTIQTKLFRYIFLKNSEDIEHASAKSIAQKDIQEVDYAVSAMWLLRREVIEYVGYLDENIFFSPEDVDYCLRIWKAGFSVVYNPNVSSVHHAQEITRGFKINKAFFHHVKGLAYYFRKHGYLFSRPRIRKS